MGFLVHHSIVDFVIICIPLKNDIQNMKIHEELKEIILLSWGLQYLITAQGKKSVDGSIHGLFPLRRY